MSFEEIKKKHKAIDKKADEFFNYAEKGFNFNPNKAFKGLEKKKKVKKSFNSEGLRL